jgi:hypothetical protein
MSGGMRPDWLLSKKAINTVFQEVFSSTTRIHSTSTIAPASYYLKSCSQYFSFHLAPVRSLCDDRHVMIRLHNWVSCKDPKTMVAEESGKVVDLADQISIG